MTLKDEIQADSAAFFNTDEFAETVTLNTVAVSAVVSSQEVESQKEGMADRLDIEFQAADYPTISYRADSVTVSGVVWKYPKLIREDDYTKLVRFRRNVRPRI